MNTSGGPSTVYVRLPLLTKFHLGSIVVFSIGRKASIGDVDELGVLQEVIDFMEGISSEEFFEAGEQLQGLRAWCFSGILSSLERVSGDDDLV